MWVELVADLRRAVILGVALVAVPISGCSPMSGAPPPSISPTVTATSAQAVALSNRQICGSWTTFLRDGLRIVNATKNPSGSGTDDSDDPVTRAAGCDVFGANGDSAGYLVVTSCPGEAGPQLGALAQYYSTADIDGVKVWIWNRSTDGPSGGETLRVAVSIDGWCGEILLEPTSLQARDGRLVISDAESDAVAKYLVDITRKVAQSQ